MEKTIKEFADELGVTKDKVKYQIKKLPTNYLHKVGKITYIKSEGIQQLYELFGENYPLITHQKLPTLPTCFTHLESIIKVLEDNTQLLQEQLKEKDKQIESLQEQLKVKDRQIENTNMSLQASQTLQAKNIQLLEFSKTDKKSIFNIFKKNTSK